MKDMFGRELKEKDICFRIKTVTSKYTTRVVVSPVTIDYFTESKVKVGDKVYVNSANLVLASHKGLVI